MEDKKMMKIIQENYEKEHKKYLENLKKERKQTKIFAIVAITIVIISFIGLYKMSEKSVETCLKNGKSYNYCFKTTNN